MPVSQSDYKLVNNQDEGGLLGLHPVPVTMPIPLRSVAGWLLDAAGADRGAARRRPKVPSFRYWDQVRMGSSEAFVTGQGFNAVKFNPGKPARTIRRNDGNLGMHGAMHWHERRRFSLPEFKRFAFFPDGFRFAGPFDEGIRQIGNCLPPLFMRAISGHIRTKVLPRHGGHAPASEPMTDCDGYL
jgi:DNA (cytosine-5)-methyltransferase 1